MARAPRSDCHAGKGSFVRVLGRGRDDGLVTLRAARSGLLDKSTAHDEISRRVANSLVLDLVTGLANLCIEQISRPDFVSRKRGDDLMDHIGRADGRGNRRLLFVRFRRIEGQEVGVVSVSSTTSVPRYTFPLPLLYTVQLDLVRGGPSSRTGRTHPGGRGRTTPCGPGRSGRRRSTLPLWTVP